MSLITENTIPIIHSRATTRPTIHPDVHPQRTTHTQCHNHSYSEGHRGPARASEGHIKVVINVCACLLMKRPMSTSLPIDMSLPIGMSVPIGTRRRYHVDYINIMY